MSYDYFGDGFFPSDYWADEYWPLYGSSEIIVTPEYTGPGIAYTSKFGQLHYVSKDVIPEYTGKSVLVEYVNIDKKVEYVDG